MAKITKSKKSSLGRSRLLAIYFVIIFAGLGVYLTWRILAAPAGAQASLEAENSTLSGSASVGNDANASGGKYVQFGP